MRIEQSVPIVYEDIYKKPFDGLLIDYIAQYDRMQIIDIALKCIYNQEWWTDYTKSCKYIFRDSASEIYKIISRNIRSEKLHVSPLVSCQTGLELLRFAFSIKSTNSKQVTYENLLNIFLIINEELNNRSDNTLKDIKDSESQLAYLFYITTLPYNDYTNKSIETYAISNVYKSCRLFEFCHNHTKLKELLPILLNKYHCNTYGEYIKRMVYIFSSVQNGKYKIILDKGDDNYTNDKLFFDSISVKYNAVIDKDKNIDYIEFRNYPLINVDNDTYWVINNYFVIGKLFDSISFDLSSIAKDKKLSIDVFQIISQEFMENILLYDILDKIFNYKNCIKLTGEQCRKTTQEPNEADFYARNWNDIFLIECKDVTIKKEYKYIPNYEDIKKNLYEKFVKKPNGDRAAIKQLVYNIKRILNNEFPYDKGIKNKKVKIYPILVVGRSIYAIYGISNILNDFFKEELKDNINSSKVKDLILCDIDTLILYQTTFGKNNMDIKSLIISYYKNHTSKITYDSIYKKYQSFGDYICNNIRPNAMVMDILQPFLEKL